MTETLQSVQQPRPIKPAWVALLSTIGGFLLAAVVQVAGYLVFGLCTESDRANCSADTLPTWWQSLLVGVVPYLLWVAPSAVAVALGVRALRSGNAKARTVTLIALVVFVSITVAAMAMGWL